MNILLIGNGFDLAHGLPTRYMDFLEWVKAEYGLYCDLREQDEDITKKANNIQVDWAIKPCPSKIKVGRLEIEEKQLELWKCISENVWINYFLHWEMFVKQNWIDFENEIGMIIKSLEKDKENRDMNDQIKFLSNTYLDKKFLHTGFDTLFTSESRKGVEKQEISYLQLREKLSKDLDKLIRALEIYLSEYVEKREIKVVSPDIQNIMSESNKRRRCKILNFNYTNTYERTYMHGINFLINDIDYVHGKADMDNSIENNNMVLGVDEYLSKKRKDRDTEFITFKKFYQRIYKQTGCEYKKWVDKIKRDYLYYLQKYNRAEEIGSSDYGTSKLQVGLDKHIADVIKNEGCKTHNLYIFGHSLDVTDRDILCDLILNDNVYTTIFYPDKEELGRKITNLVKVIGQDELIKRTGGSTMTIEFKKQQNMVEINS